MTAHVPAEHTSPAGHAVPQAPQLPLSVWVLVQTPPQRVSPVWQLGEHVPPEQTWPAGQALPHAPQFWSSVGR